MPEKREENKALQNYFQGYENKNSCRPGAHGDDERVTCSGIIALRRARQGGRKTLDDRVFKTFFQEPEIWYDISFSHQKKILTLFSLFLLLSDHTSLYPEILGHTYRMALVDGHTVK
jgi:hypothetical protein